MPVPVFRLRNVPEDEAEDIRVLLEENNIDHYETPAGNWGISMPSIWLRDDDQLEQAKCLIDEYQKARQLRVRAEHEQSKRDRSKKSISSEWLASPMQLILYIGFAVIILYFSIKPFISFGL